MPANVSTHSSSAVPALFEGYSRALLLRTAAFLLRHHASRMRGLHMDPQAVAYLEQQAAVVEQQQDEQDAAFLPSAVPALFEGISRALVLHAGSFLLEHHAITMRGLHFDAQAVAYLEKAAEAVEQQMDEQDAAFPQLLDNAVLEVLRAPATRGHQEIREARHSFTPITTAMQRPGK